MISIVMPSVFITIGVIVVCLAISNDTQDPIERVTIDRIKLFIMSYFMIWAFVFNTSSYCGSVVLER